MRNAVHTLLTESPCFMNEQHDFTLLGWLQSFFSITSCKARFSTQLRIHLFETSIFMLKVACTLNVRSFHPAELALPSVERGVADTVLAAYVLGSSPRFDGLKDRDDMGFRKL